MAAGFPLMAAFQPGVFYPPSVLFYLFPFFDAVRLTFIAHFLIQPSGRITCAGCGSILLSCVL